MKFSIKALLERMQRLRIPNPRISRLQQQVRDLQDQVNKQGGFSAGHYYSPIPAQEEVLEYLRTRDLSKRELPGINLNEQNQFGLLKEYSHFYEDIQFPGKQDPDFRYYSINDWYSYGDAFFLYSFLRRHKPRRIIEVGSGFTSAVILDTLDRVSGPYPGLTFIEPYPERLKSLLRKEDEGRVEIIAERIQEVPIERFTSLKPGDLLLVDSTHVVKCGSDVQRLMFDILPFLPDGIFVHFHDIYHPFDYPEQWFLRGMYWNESYFLRAFLSYNCEWEVYFFSNYVAFMFSDFISDKLPRCATNPGSSLYLRRVGKS